jgi:hypothetical protein
MPDIVVVLLPWMMLCRAYLTTGFTSAHVPVSMDWLRAVLTAGHLDDDLDIPANLLERRDTGYTWSVLCVQL